VFCFEWAFGHLSPPPPHPGSRPLQLNPTHTHSVMLGSAQKRGRCQGGRRRPDAARQREIAGLMAANPKLTWHGAHSVGGSNLVARAAVAAQTPLGREIAGLQAADPKLSLPGAHRVGGSNLVARAAVAAGTAVGVGIGRLMAADPKLSLHGAQAWHGKVANRQTSPFGGSNEDDTEVLDRDGRFRGLTKVQNRSMVAMFLRLIAWLNNRRLNTRGFFHDYELMVTLSLDGDESVKNCYLKSKTDVRTQKKMRAGGGRDKLWTYKRVLEEYEVLLAAQVRVAVRLRPRYGRACARTRGAHM
jgi:hypothetical protein